MSAAPPRTLTASDYVDGVRAGDRRTLAKAITLLESRRPDEAELGQEVLERLLPHTGGAIRVGVTGSPGVGKSTFIEALGLHVIGKGHRVAVLAVDPSSRISGGAILGDKTRMEALAREPDAFIRPSPSGSGLGGVAERTREVRVLVEAAGFDVVIVETVGVGQSETEVHSMVDFFAVLLQPGAGDELQGIKRGILELADALVVTKADGALHELADRARAQYTGALHLLRPPSAAWRPRAVTASALPGRSHGIDTFWDTVEAHRAALVESGELDRKRRHQARAWMAALIDQGLRAAFERHPTVAELLPTAEQEVESGKITPATAAQRLLDAFLGG